MICVTMGLMCVCSDDWPLGTEYQKWAELLQRAGCRCWYDHARLWRAYRTWASRRYAIRLVTPGYAPEAINVRRARWLLANKKRAPQQVYASAYADALFPVITQYLDDYGNMRLWLDGDVCPDKPGRKN